MSDELNLGTCCACQNPSQTVRNVMALHFRTPHGFGWGCFECGLPAEGAIAVICDECLESNAEIREFVKGEPLKKGRAPIGELTQPFEHDLSKHGDDPEEWTPTADVEAYGGDPVVLYDPFDGPIRDSQLTQICEEVSQALHQLPPYWRNEVSGKLAAAVEAYVNHGADPAVHSAPTEEQVALLLQYFRLYIAADCWRDNGGRLATLRQQVIGLETLADIDRWLHDCLEFGLDPL